MSYRLQSLAIPMLSMADCNASYPYFVNYETMFCAGYLEGGKGMALSYSLYRIDSMILTFHVPPIIIYNLDVKWGIANDRIHIFCKNFLIFLDYKLPVTQSP